MPESVPTHAEVREQKLLAAEEKLRRIREVCERVKHSSSDDCEGAFWQVFDIVTEDE